MVEATMLALKKGTYTLTGSEVLAFYEINRWLADIKLQMDADLKMEKIKSDIKSPEVKEPIKKPKKIKEVKSE